MAQALDLLIDRTVFFDKQILARHVCFRLIVIVVRHEKLDGGVGEELAHLARQLRGEDFVRRDDERGALDLFNHLGHRVCFARTRCAQ